MIKLFSFKTLPALILILLFFWYLFTFKITEVPPGINGDEAAIGYNAALVAKNGYDQSGRFLPLFVSAFDLTDWKQPVTFYSTVLAFRLFGPSFSLLREVSVFIILISGLLMFFFSKELLGSKGAFVALLLFLTIPSVLIQSHLALENIAPIPFIILWLWMLIKYEKKSEAKYLIFAALFLGGGLFTYPGMRIILPVYTVLTVSFLYYLNRKKNFIKIFKENLKFILIILIFPAVMYSVKGQYPGAILAYNRPHAVPSYQEFILPYISSFDPSFLFIQGDSTPYHSTGRQGVFLLATLPLFVLGMFSITRRKDSLFIFILLTFFLTPLLYGLPASIHRGSRLLVLLPSYTIIAALGFVTLGKIKNNTGRLLVISLSVLLIALNYTDFLRDYWFDYPGRVKAEFAKPYHLAFEEAVKLSQTDHLTPYIQGDFRNQNPIAIDFFATAYFPKGIQKWTDSGILPPNSVIIVADYVLSRKKDIPQKVLGEGEFGILINENR